LTGGDGLFRCAQFCAHQQARPLSTLYDSPECKPLQRRELSNFIDIHRPWRKLLISRATNLCKQGVAGSIPVTSTTQFNDLREASKALVSSWCTFWCTTSPQTAWFGCCMMASSAARFASVRMWL